MDSLFDLMGGFAGVEIGGVDARFALQRVKDLARTPDGFSKFRNMTGQRRNDMHSLVYLISPYRGKNDKERQANIRYAKACMKDCVSRGEAPFASHLLYTQKGILDDSNESERNKGMAAGQLWLGKVGFAVLYKDRGFSEGMVLDAIAATRAGKVVEIRTLKGWGNG